VAPPGSVVTDWSACWYWTGTDRANADIDPPVLSVFRLRGQDRLRNALVNSGQRWLLPRDLVPLDGNLYVTSPLRTAWDLGRFFPPVTALGGMDALARLNVFTVQDMVDEVERFRRQRGVVQLRVLAPLVDGRSESPGESALRWRWLQAKSLPLPELQVAVHDEYGVPYRWIDLGLPDLLFGAEYDGEEFHNELTLEHDVRRRDELAREHGWDIQVFRRANVFGQRNDATSRLLAAYDEAKRARRGRC
jgi:hypothetical protein